MIKKTLIYTILLFAIYCAALKFLKKDAQASQGFRQRNFAKAQNYIYNDAEDKNVIVGSSLSANLPMDSLPGFANLAFTGQGVFDGLTIIDKEAKRPETVYIEMNKVFRTADVEFYNGIYNPVMYNLRKYFSVFRDGQHPLAILNDIISNPRKYFNFKNKPASRKPVYTGANKTVNKSIEPLSVLLTMINKNAHVYTYGPDINNIDRATLQLKDEVNKLLKRGINVVFFEMPVHCKLYNLKEAVMVREAFFRTFPTSRFKYIMASDCQLYRTTDGMHLNQYDYQNYVGYFKKMAQKVQL